jgi:hypothetical protein
MFSMGRLMVFLMSSSIGYGVGYGGQIGSEHSPTYPSIEAFLATVPTSAKVSPPFEHTDPPFSTR